MPINVYTGLMRSGKSYEVVSQVVVEAIARGRRVVTNVDGIDNDLVRAYVSRKRKVDLAAVGNVVHVTNEDVFREDFLPYYDDAKAAHIDTIVQPGDLVAIDEAWRFWGTDCKLHKHHKSFFLEHGHFTHPDTGVACDLVLMIQDMGTLHRFVKAVVAFSFRTHKKVALGLGNTYSITMWEGWKQNKATRAGEWVRRYDKEIFPLYNSFKGGADGKTVNVDRRQNILANPRLWLVVGVAVLGGGWSAWNVWRFFNPAPVQEAKAPAAVTSSSGAIAAPGGTARPSDLSASSRYSDEWRYVGRVARNGYAFVIVMGRDGRVRVESPSMFTGSGLASSGMIDGQTVTAFTGGVAPAGEVGK